MAVLKNVAGKRLLFVMATDAEYGADLKQLFEPFNCGVGPVEAAMNTQRAVTQLKPDLVVSLGSAGSARLEQAKVYQVHSVSYRDMDASAFGFTKGETPFLGLPAKVALKNEIPNVPSASLNTGADVVSGDAYTKIDDDMVDMETWSILRVCMSNKLPLIGLRGVSDGAEPVSEYSDWTRYLHVIDQNLAVAVGQLFDALEVGSFPQFQQFD